MCLILGAGIQLGEDDGSSSDTLGRMPVTAALLGLPVCERPVTGDDSNPVEMLTSILLVERAAKG